MTNDSDLSAFLSGSDNGLINEIFRIKTYRL